MAHGILKLDSEWRAGEKQASRDEDRARLLRGEIGREALAQENNFFAPLNLQNSRIIAIGHRRIGSR